MAQALFIKPFLSVPSPSRSWSQPEVHVDTFDKKINVRGRLELVAMGMLTQRNFSQKRKKGEVFKESMDEVEQRNWRKLMLNIAETGSAVPVLRGERIKKQTLSKNLVVGTLVRFKQLKKWNIVSEILEWLRIQHWWNFSEMDYVMLITAYGKLGDFNHAERTFNDMTKKGYAQNVVSHTALMEAYGRAGRYNNAEAIFRRMQLKGPEPSALTYQIILKTFVEGNKFEEAEEVFMAILNDEKSPLKPDQKMFHMMICMYKKAGNYEKARKIFALMTERGIEQSTVTYNCLMSFETNYKEVSKIYDQMQRAGFQPDVVSYSLLINAYGKARKEEEAFAVFEEMVDAGVWPTRKTYNILLDAFAISGLVEQAQVVFKNMRTNRYTPDLCSYTTMLSTYVNASDMEGAEKFFRRLKQDGIEPNVVTYGTLINGYAKVNDLEKMMEKYKEMKSVVSPNQIILTTIMDAYGNNKDFGSAVVWYREMESLGIAPDQKAKNVLLSLAKTEDEQKEAVELVGLDDHDFKQMVLQAPSYVDDDDEDEYEDDEDEDEDEGGDDDDEEEDYDYVDNVG